MTFKELYAQHQAEGGTMSVSQFRYRLNYDVRKGRMVKLGRDNFEKATEHFRQYRYEYTLVSRAIAEDLVKKGIRINLFETHQLREFGVDVGENRVFVYVERGKCDEVAAYVAKEYSGFKVLVRNFISESPCGGKHNWQARPEKWMVDLISDKELTKLLTPEQQRKVFVELAIHYALDVNKMRRYARRRASQEQINAFLSPWPPKWSVGDDSPEEHFPLRGNTEERRNGDLKWEET